MSKPDGIPDRVMIEAEAVNDAIFRMAHDEVHIMGHTARKTAIARAILAAEQREREACAQEMDLLRKLLHAQHEVLDIGREDEAYRIAAAAIRNRGTEND